MISGERLVILSIIDPLGSPRRVQETPVAPVVQVLGDSISPLRFTTYWGGRLPSVDSLVVGCRIARQLDPRFDRFGSSGRESSMVDLSSEGKAVDFREAPSGWYPENVRQQDDKSTFRSRVAAPDRFYRPKRP